MANPNKDRGTRWETEAVRFLASRLPSGVFNSKPRQAGAADVGDIHVAEDFVLQCKDWATWSKKTLYDWIDDANLQAIHAGRAYGAVVVKRRRAPGSTGRPNSAVVAMSLDTFADILVDLLEGRDALETIEALEAFTDNGED
jgi:hypothetical protein